MQSPISQLKPAPEQKPQTPIDSLGLPPVQHAQSQHNHIQSLGLPPIQQRESEAPQHNELAQYLGAASQESGVDPKLLAAVAYVESTFNPNARSPVGAVGYMQLMPDTAKSLGVDPNIPSQNIRGGARYLSKLYHQYGNWVNALAAYNGGGDAVNYLKRHGTLAGYGNNETYNYVNKIHQLIQGE